MDRMNRQALARAEKQSRRLPEDARCPCGERDIRTLIPRDDGVLCQSCDNRKAGRPVVERNHIAGKHSADDRVPLGVNEHRIVTDMQNDWGRTRMANRQGNPLIMVSNMVQGAIEAAIVLLQRALNYVKALPALN